MRIHSSGKIGVVKPLLSIKSELNSPKFIFYCLKKIKYKDAVI